MRTTFGQRISNPALAGSGSTTVLGVGGGGGPCSPPSCGRKVNGTPKMLTYSGSNNPVSGLISSDVRRKPRPTTCFGTLFSFAFEAAGHETERATVLGDRAHDVLRNPSRYRGLDLQSHLNLGPGQAGKVGNNLLGDPSGICTGA